MRVGIVRRVLQRNGRRDRRFVGRGEIVKI